jgi:hypothetical protein
MLSRDRRRRALVLDALAARVKQFRSREGSWPFRVPHEPLDLDAIVDTALAGEPGRLPREAIKSRSVLHMEWSAGDTWELWAVTLPSGLHVYCDSGSHESRVLASAKRGNPSDADGFLLERLAESRGHLFGIEMAGAPPDRIRSATGDREFLADVFVELLEGTEAEEILGAGSGAPDFRAVVVRWLDGVLSAPPMTRRQPRVRDEDPFLL